MVNIRRLRDEMKTLGEDLNRFEGGEISEISFAGRTVKTEEDMRGVLKTLGNVAFYMDALKQTGEDRELTYRPVKCKSCGLPFQTSDPVGAVRCPSCPNSGTSGHGIEELSRYWVPPPKHEYKQGEEVPIQTTGSMSDEAPSILHTMYKFKKKMRRWY